MDILIEERARMSIKDMFAKYGESWFRDRETAALESLAGAARRHVISTGGGIVTQPRNLPLLRQIGWVVLLSAAPEEIYARVARNKDRPLLHVPDPRGRVRELLAERAPMYAAAAQFTVDSTGLRHEDVVATVLAEARRVFGWSK
jgi:shikimate kinase